MKRPTISNFWIFRIFFSLFLVCGSLNAQNANFEWVETTGQFSGSSSEQTHDVAVDGSNNIYAIGNKGGAINFWNGSFVSSGNKGSTDIWITKFDENQNFQWNTNIGGGGIDDGNSIDVDAAGNVYITGQFQQGFSGTDFGYGNTNGQPLFTTVNPASGNNIGFVAKINTNGVWQWVKTFDSGTCFPASISVDPNGNVYTTGRFSGTVDFNPEAGTEELTSSGFSQDAFISKLDNNGNFIWARQFSAPGGSNFDEVIGRSVTSDANFVYVKGYFENVVDFELGTFGSQSLSGKTSGFGDFFIVKIESNGNDTRWAHKIERGTSSGYNLAGNTLALSDDGSKLFVTGESSNSGFVARLTNGNFSVSEDWLNTFGATSKAEAIGVDSDDNIFVTGYFNGTVDFDPGSNTFNLSAMGTNDAFVTRLDANGNFGFAKQFGGSSSNNRGYGIELGTNGEIYSGGWFTNTTDFDPNTGTEDRTSEGSRDLYIHKMFEAPSCSDQFATDTRTECEGYTWIDGNQYFSDNNTAMHTVVGAVSGGCDSIYTLDLTIIPNSSGTEDYTGCQGDGYEVVVGGTTYNEANPTGIETLTAVSGCDSIVTIDLTFNAPAAGTEDYTGCQGDGYEVVVGGTTYNEANPTGTEMLTAASGCDSIVTIDLTFNAPAAGTEDYAGCQGDGYEVVVGGTTYNEANPTGTETLTAASGCDSIVTIDLTFNAPATGTEDYTGCQGDGYEVIVGGTTYNEANPTGTETLTAASGCDSIVTIDLTFNAPATGTDVQTACGSFTWIDGNTYSTNNNTATYTIVGGAVNGCDSIVTLDLTITSAGPAIIFQNIQNVTCAGGTDGSVEAVASGGSAPYNYEWPSNGTNTAVNTGLDAGTYTVEVTDDNGCTGTETVTITEPDPIIVAANINNANCGENNGGIQLTTNGGNPDYTYDWSPIVDSIASVDSVVAGLYAVTITDDSGCTLDTVFSVETTGSLAIDVLPEESTIQSGGSVGLTVNVGDDVEGESYSWSPSEGLSCLSCINPDASPGSTTTYYVTVETPDGCSSIDSLLIKVEDGCNELFVPNMFSPNGDGQNDEFCVYGDCIQEYDLSIYNRWGQLVYKSDNQDNCWDGKFNTKMMNTGVFAYKLYIKTKQGEEIERSGNINLTR